MMKRTISRTLTPLLLVANHWVAAHASDSLAVRNAHAMPYHEARGTVMLFGGADERRVLGDLWEWDGKNWHKISATGPASRTFPCLVYDHDRKRLVLFGGNRVLFGTENDKDTFLDDMWIGTARAGTKSKPRHLPPAPKRAWFMTTRVTAWFCLEDTTLLPARELVSAIRGNGMA